MNLYLLNEIEKMSKEELETRLGSITFNENEAKLFQKSKELIDQCFEMKRFDSGEKVFTATMLYYGLESIKKNDSRNISNQK